VSDAGVCFGGQCHDVLTCDDGNPCTDDWLDPGGQCTGFPTASQGKVCPFGLSDGVCFQGECVCNSHDDCEDGDETTDDHCWDAVCYHQ
jgi:hypothetical protein